MKRWRAILIALGAVLVFGMSNLTILQKQEIVENGRQVLLRLAPVDPRSLMQGDYMRLRYHGDVFPQAETRQELPWRGTVVLALDEVGVARFARVEDGTPLGPDEIRLAYRSGGRFGSLRYGAESFFFQEGHASLFAGADFGVLRVDRDGASVLVGLARKDGTLIVPD